MILNGHSKKFTILFIKSTSCTFKLDSNNLSIFITFLNNNLCSYKTNNNASKIFTILTDKIYTYTYSVPFSIYFIKIIPHLTIRL